MKKILGVVLSAAMMLSLSACGFGSAPAPSETTTAAAVEGVLQAVAKEDLKAGVIHIGNPADGSGYSYAHDLVIVAMQEELGLEGCQIIFATSWGYMDTCEALAEEYPEVIFSHATVAVQNQENAEVTGGVNAFAMGVNSVNPEAKVYVKVTNSWLDPEGEGQAAQARIADGCDVIGQHCDTLNPQMAAEKANVWGVGYNSDMSKDAPAAVLTSTMWDWSALLYRSG